MIKFSQGHRIFVLSEDVILKKVGCNDLKVSYACIFYLQRNIVNISKVEKEGDFKFDGSKASQKCGCMFAPL